MWFVLKQMSINQRVRGIHKHDIYRNRWSVTSVFANMIGSQPTLSQIPVWLSCDLIEVCYWRRAVVSKIEAQGRDWCFIEEWRILLVLVAWTFTRLKLDYRPNMQKHKDGHFHKRGLFKKIVVDSSVSTIDSA